MRILMAATRLAGNDGVSLEAEKVRQVLEAMGHEVIHLAGELSNDRAGFEVPAMHFQDSVAREFAERAFGEGGEDRALVAEILEAGRALARAMRNALGDDRPDLMLVQNAWAIPMHLPLAPALVELARSLGVPAISHNHDYPWERERFARNKVQPLIEGFFPPPGPIQLSINTLAQAALLARRGLSSLLLPNVMDFDQTPPAARSDFKAALGLSGRTLLLQPTRVVPRKRIELSIDLAARLKALGHDPVVLVTHPAGDEGYAYKNWLQDEARKKNVDLRFADAWVGGEHGERPFRLWDAYHHADLVTYPSAYEGFGNALLEAVWAKKPVLVGRYPVYLADIQPLGFRFVEVSERITPQVAEQVDALLADPGLTRDWVEHNHALAKQHFGYPRLRRVLEEAIDAARRKTA